MKAASAVSEKLLQGQSLGYILLKCQEVLKSAARPLSTLELQTALVHAGVNRNYGIEYYQSLFSDPAFVAVLRHNSRLDYDQKTRKWSFKSPFADFTSKNALFQGISRELDGLDVTQELLDYHPQMADWIQQLLEQRVIRAIRALKSLRCKNYAPDSGFVCDLYETRVNKCDNCAALKGLIIYNKARPDTEDPAAEANDATYALDEDLKELWASVTLPAMEAILEEMKVKSQLSKLESKRKPRRRGPGGGHGDSFSMSGRVNKIANAHIYTMEEFKAELTSKSGQE